ncbi:MAG: NfeD family protein [Flavobacteriales bacterium]|nr:NfeD family protein [Flavobacteriales bacterium]
MDYLNALDPLLRTFWYVAIPASLIFAVQTIMTFIGANSNEGLEADFDGNLDSADAPFQLFSLRNLINFLLGFSWTGISFFSTIQNKNLLIAFSLLIGVAFVYLFWMIIKQVQKLAENNSFNFMETISLTAEVYMNIPSNGGGKGKVLVSVKGSVHELDAISTGEKIEAGTLVKITDIKNKNILVVQPL